jgi:hypothetical protein
MEVVELAPAGMPAGAPDARQQLGREYLLGLI